MNNSICKLCGSKQTLDFFDFTAVPTQDGVMYESKTAAINAPKGPILLCFCHSCGFIRNEGYDPAKISFDAYDFSNDHSPLFRDFVQNLCKRLVQDYDLKGKKILDIGCGDGIFLQTICALGDNTGIGIDSGFDHQKRVLPEGLKVEYIRDYYSEKYAHLQADFIACRLVIDLLDDQIAFLSMLRKNLTNNYDTIVYVEVPNAIHTFQENIIWNVVYEHAAWFTDISFRYLFESCGFEVLQVQACWNNEFLGVEARPRPMSQSTDLPAKEKIAALEKIVLDFSNTYQSEMTDCRAKIENIRRLQTKTLAWGAGARALTFFNIFEVEDIIPYIVDINTKRQGKFLPGSGHPIVAPEFIQTYQPDLIVITNPTYAEEIKEQVRALGCEAAFWVL